MTNKTSVFLIASLCVNAALIGGVAAGLYTLKSKPPETSKKSFRHHKGPRPPDRFEEELARAVMDQLVSEDRSAFRAAMAKEWRATREARFEQRQLRNDLAELLKQTEFKRDEAEAIYEKLRDGETGMRQRMTTHILDILEKMDAEDRKALVTELQKSAEKLQRKRIRFESRDGQFKGGPPKRPEDDNGFEPPPPPPED